MPSTRKIVVVTSCTGEKLFAPDNQLIQNDFRLDKHDFHVREAKLSESILPAEIMYTGQQHKRLMRGIRELRETGEFDIDLRIVSAGYGLINGDQLIAPYECTFQNMSMREISEWSDYLRIPTAIQKLFQQQADLILVALGEQYLRALKLNDSTSFTSPIVFFCSPSTTKRIPRGDTNCLRIVQLSSEHAKRFHCGLVGLKGELVGRILRRLAKEGEPLWDLLMNTQEDLLALLDEPAPVKSPKAAATPNLERVDKVISLPETWTEQVQQKQLRFFLPDWDDMVDPDYDFETDTHSGGGGAWSNQVYAHQLFKDERGNHIPNFDGMLVSRAVAEKPSSKMSVIEQYAGIHRYLRVPHEVEILGDCGAFSYLLADKPPYSTEDMLDYYTRLGFNYGVSIDHLLFGASTEEGKQYRYKLTIDNARDFIKEHQRQRLPWTAIGALQGMNPVQYADAAKQYVEWGYTYLAIGGQVRSQTRDILEIARAIREVIPKNVKLHLFGVARLEALNQFAEVGIDSVDSASYLRQAWIRMGENYIGHNGLYAAIRIPEAQKLIRQGQVDSYDVEKVRELEREALKALCALDRDACNTDEALHAVFAYKDAIGLKLPTRIIAQYRATLQNRPWKECNCAICEDIGINVMIFRGNNRNRRRGFHNNYMFCRLMEKVLTEKGFGYNWKGVEVSDQLELPM
jgi:hypothetical protein